MAFDTLGFVLAYGQGELESDQELIDGFQALIDSGLVWSLQGHYGRMAKALIDEGHCIDTHEVLR